MSANTSIEWTHKPGTVARTWNMVTGCDKVSPGCGLPRPGSDDAAIGLTGGCYAMAMAKRLKAMGQAKYQTDGDPRTSGPGFGVALHPDTLGDPLTWRKPSTVFANSMGDLFHARVPVEFVARVWAVMAATPQHTYIILTKRPERMARIVGDNDLDGGHRLIQALTDEQEAQALYEAPWPLPNVILGTSIELAAYNRRADHLRNTAAATRVISAEPLLGPLYDRSGEHPDLNLNGIDWLIIGGESGPGARPLDLRWVRELLAHCPDSRTAPFVKQLGTRWAGSGKGGDWSTWPEDLRIREYPQAVSTR